MAIGRHVDIVRSGADSLLRWQRKHPGEVLDLSGASFDGEELSHMDFSCASLMECSFKRCTLGLIEFQGVNAHLADFSKSEFIACRFDDAILSSARFEEAKIHTSTFNRANMDRCHLVGAVFWWGVEARYANLHASDMRSTTFFGVDLTEASLRCATVMGTDFTQSTLCRTDFWNARVAGCNFCNVDLSSAINLISIHHRGPSSVGIDTLVKSNGKIPHVFLDGCGVPKWMQHVSELCDLDITAHQVSEIVSTKIFGSRTEGPLFMGGVFISCSSSDRAFVELLEKRLKDSRITVWVYYHDLLAGSIERQIATAIGIQHVVLVVLSESSLSSDWVWHEIEQARKLEQSQNRDVLCPISIDDSWMNPAGVQTSVRRQLEEHGAILQYLKKKHILEFTNHHIDEGQFDKLIRGMKLNYPRPTGVDKNSPPVSPATESPAPRRP